VVGHPSLTKNGATSGWAVTQDRQPNICLGESTGDYVLIEQSELFNSFSGGIGTAESTHGF